MYIKSNIAIGNSIFDNPNTIISKCKCSLYILNDRKLNFYILNYLLLNIMYENIRVNSYIGKKGYTIPKRYLTSNELNNIKNELFMKPFVAIKTKDDINPFPAYRENDNKIYVPRFYGIKKYGLPDKTELSQGEDISVNFVKELREYQKKIVNIYTNYVNTPIVNTSNITGNGAILEVFTGRGKTVMALDIISKISKKTLIIVHKEFLMNQWIERINEFLPTANMGEIQASVCDVKKDKDIVIGECCKHYILNVLKMIYFHNLV